MAFFCRLPESFERVVLLGVNPRGSTVAAASIALSPFLHPHQEVVLTYAICCEGGNADADASLHCPHDAQWAREAEATLATVRQEVLRSRLDDCLDGQRPVAASANALPFQYFIGHQYPLSESEVTALLSRVRVHGASSSSSSSLSGPLVVRKERDVLVCILNADELPAASVLSSSLHESVVRQLQRVVRATEESGSDNPSPRSGGCVIAVTDDRSRHALEPLVRAVPPSSVLVVARARELSPPATEWALTKAAITGEGKGRGALFTNMLTAFCSGVLLGVLPQLPVCRHHKSPFVPIDIAVNTALCQAIEQMRGRTTAGAAVAAGTERASAAPPPSTSSSQDGPRDPLRIAVERHSVIAVEPTKPTDTMSWGMFGEYLSDYYGRYAKAIEDFFPAKGILPQNPSALNFVFDPCDTVNYGIDTLDVNRALEHKAAMAHREKLRTSLPSTWGFAGYLSNLDSAASRAGEHARRRAASPYRAGGADTAGLPGSLRERIPGLVSSPKALPSSASRVSAQLAVSVSYSDTGAYQRLLSNLASDTRSVPLLQYTSLKEVDWNMYVCFAARVVLSCLAERAGPSALSFPFPTRMFANELVFDDALSAPPQQSRVRRAMGSADWICRAGMNANGVRGEMVPGFTPECMSVLLAQPSVVRAIEAAAASSAPSVSASSLTAAEEEARAASSKDKALQRAKKILIQIGDTQNHLQLRTIGWMVYKFFKKIYHHMQLSTGAYEHLRRINALPRTTVVYMPLHRSYSDFLIMSYLMVIMGLKLPHVVAGEDFLGLGVITDLMRGSGAFFMRRAFRGDALYGTLFKEYVAHMVRSGLTLEFFIEGTRSRTGKTMVPKLGVLKFIIDAFLTQGVAVDRGGRGASVAAEGLQDVVFVPVSVSYEELLEAKVYADELLGIPKPRESVPNMVKAVTQLTHKYGSVNVHFGEPISLKAARENPFECPSPFQPKEAGANDSATPTAGAVHYQQRAAATTAATAAVVVSDKMSPVKSNREASRLVTSLAWRITYALQQNVVITAPALVAAAIETLMPIWELERTKAKGAPPPPMGLPLERVVTAAAQISEAVRLRGGRLLPSLTTTTNNGSVDWEAVVGSALRNLSRFVKAEESPRTVESGGVRSVRFDPPTISSQLGLNISTNQLIHVFVDEALVAVAAHAFGEAITDPSSPGASIAGRSISMQTLRQTTQLLRGLLSTEFPNFAAFSPCSYDSWLRYAIARLTLGEEESRTAARCRRLREARNVRKECVEPGPHAGSLRDSPDFVFVPETRLYGFLLQLLLPHVEALYVVAVTALACFGASTQEVDAQGNAHRPVLVRLLITAAYKAAQRLFEQRIVEYIVACNRETVTHYFQSLAEMKLLRAHTVMDLGSAYVPGEAATLHTERAADTNADGGAPQRPYTSQLPGLERLVKDLQALRWHPSSDPQEDVDTVSRVVLTCYHNVSRGAKL